MGRMNRFRPGIFFMHEVGIAPIPASSASPKNGAVQAIAVAGMESVVVVP
jgi:hypothetical protein